MILFLNKCDLLKRKLKSGVQVAKYLPSYGERSNDSGTVVKCTLFFFTKLYGYILGTFADWVMDRSERKVQGSVEGTLAHI